MLHSLMDSEIWEQEFSLFIDQGHFEKVWKSLEPNLLQYIAEFTAEMCRKPSAKNAMASYQLFLQELISKNEKSSESYHALFSESLMEEYREDLDGFKSYILQKKCPVIRVSLNSRAEALNEWKAKFFHSKAQDLYDSFYSMMFFARNYEREIDESAMDSINTIEGNHLIELLNDNCYLPGVIGAGIISNILNLMYPRVFPGEYKKGLYSLYFLVSIDARNGIDMPSGTSEFCMVKDDIRSKTGIIEAGHNYYYNYETFGLYCLRIYRLLVREIEKAIGMKFPSNYRFWLTNSFYDYVTLKHKHDIQTLTGNDDILKFWSAI